MAEVSDDREDRTDVDRGHSACRRASGPRRERRESPCPWFSLLVRLVE
jgi:hypothetical protein